MPKRKLGDWVDAFYEHTEILSSPPLFRRWAGIVTIAGALERKVWIKTKRGELYPNLYVLLIGPPGVGKTVLTNRIYELWSELEGQHLAATSVSKASMIDELRDAERRIIKPNSNPSVISFNSTKISSNELAVLIPSYENDFMNTLTDIYDCHYFSERKRTKELHFIIDNPQINMVAGTTPSYLSSLLPDGAWDQGFLSRTMLVYSGDSVMHDLFGDEQRDAKIWNALVHDLQIIGDLYGKMELDKDVVKAIEAWHRSGGEPRPEHPKLVNYCTRRSAHLIKLCMIASASASDKLRVTLDHYQTALNWLIEFETFIPDIFKSMAVGGDSRAIQDCWHFVYTIWMKENKPIAEHRIVNFLQERVPAHSVMRILEVMVKAKILRKELDAYIPKSLRDT